MGKARNYIPALKYGHKIYPEDIAGMIGLPSVGDIFYVDPDNGSDTANAGTSRNNALKTITVAYNKCTTNQDDVVLIAPTGTGTGRTAETAQLTWSKYRTHLIGNAAPCSLNMRSGMSFDTDSLSPSMIITGRSCIFSNVVIQTMQAANLVLLRVNGLYNYFDNVHFAGIGHATAGDDAGARCVEMNAASYNRFDHCMFGLDTVLRSTGNALLEFKTTCTDNEFDDCFFNSYVDSASAVFIIDTTTGGQRFNYFNRPTFFNYVSGTYGAAMTQAIQSWAGSGQYIYRDPILVGCADWCQNSAYHWFVGQCTQDAVTDYSSAVGIAANPT